MEEEKRPSRLFLVLAILLIVAAVLGTDVIMDLLLHKR